MSSDKFGKNSASICMEHNCKKLSEPAILPPIFILASYVVETETFMMIYYNVVVLLLIILIKLMSTCL